MIRRLALQMVLVAGVAVLAAGCVRQPVDETAFSRDPSLGLQADPIAPKEARRFAREAIEQPTDTPTERTREVAEASPTPAPSGGLVREELDTADTAEPSESSARDTADRSRKRSGGESGTESGSTRPRTRNRTDTDSDTDTDTGTGTDTGSGGREQDGGGTQQEPPPPAEPTFAAVAGTADAEGDAGREAPKYADSRGMTFESDGRALRVTIAFAGNIPSVLSEGEVQGVGVDFFRTDPQESDYQLFADGGSDGWKAFLQTPEGFVQYPGTFQVGGRVIRFEVPWSALGGAEPADVSSFVDWSKERTPLNEIGNDRMPDGGRLAVRP